MAIGGFNGSDPSPTLAQFQAYVQAGKIHYFLARRRVRRWRQSGGSNVSSQISSWVQPNFTAVTIGGSHVLRPDPARLGNAPAPRAAPGTV